MAALTADTLTRAYAEVGGRLVHYRIAGRGAPLLVLHQSPRSSAELAGLIEAWAPHFTCIAPDMPGLGLSEPLAALEPTMADLAAALVRFMDVLGLHEVAAYGFHTGAALAVAAAADHPDRFTAVVANGFSRWTPDEQQDFLAHYLPPFHPDANGTHLPFWWTRMRDQRLFFPWYRLTDAARMPLDAARPEEIHDQLMDILRAGDSYRSAYGAAFRGTGDAVTRLKIPALLIGTALDPLTSHQQRLPPLPDWVSVRAVDTPAAALADALDFLQRNRPPSQALAPAGRSAARRGFVTVHSGGQPMQLHWRRADHGPGPAWLLLSGPGESSETALHDWQGLGRAGTVHALDWPGHGASSPWPASGLDTPAALAALARAAATALGLGQPRLATLGDSAVVALAAAADDCWSEVEACRAHLVPDAAGHAAGAIADLAPDGVGAHLLRAWAQVRDGALFCPWYTPRHAAARAVGSLDPERMARRHVALLDAPGAAPLSRLLALADRSALLAGAVRPLTWSMATWAAMRSDLWRPETGHPSTTLRFDLD